MADHPPKVSPRPPDDSAPTALEHTPVDQAVGPFGVPPFVNYKVDKAKRELEALFEQRVAEAVAHERLEAKKREHRVTFLSAVIAAGTLASSVVGVILFIDNRVAAQTADAGKVQEKRISDTEQRLERMGAEFTEHVKTESEARQRMEKKLNALLEHEGVRDPAPTPKDGGR